MTDDASLEELRSKTSQGDRLQEGQEGPDLGGFESEVRERLEAIDAGERQKTLSTWDGPLRAFVDALNDRPDQQAAVAAALRAELGVENDDSSSGDQADPDPVDQSELLQLALRVGFEQAAPDHLEAAREAVRQRAADQI